MRREQPVETAIAAEWCAVLEVDQAHDDDDFFALGGNSMHAVRLVEGIESSLDIEFPLDVLFLDGSFKAVVEACADVVAQRKTRA
jgi:acyl carrier protein